MVTTHTPIVIMVLGVRVTGDIVDGVIMVLEVRFTRVMGGIADNTFFCQLHYVMRESYPSPPSMTELGGLEILGHPFKEDNARYFLFYNGERLHTSLGDQTTDEVYFKKPIPLNPGQASQTMHPIQPIFSS
jgi:hypothetical protein